MYQVAESKNDEHQVSTDGAHPSSAAMIGLPPRGDLEARPWILSAVGFYLIVSIVFFSTLLDAAQETSKVQALLDIIGLGEPPNISIAVLLLAGIIVTVAAFVSVWRDRREISREESDIEWLHQHGARYAQLVLAPTEQRDGLRDQDQRTVPIADRRVETLVDDRVRRMLSGEESVRSTMVPVEELRVIAQTRTARLGGFARYATSLLLLLAVLGTFAGVKAALPALIDAVAASTNPGASSSSISIVEPLRAVADAFGANALALIGAIAAGLMARGIAVGRRNLLERLELVSAEYIYGTRQMESADPLRAAVDAMRDTVDQVRQTSGSLLGIEDGLQALGQRFAAAFGSLDVRLTAIVEHQDERLHERTSAALEGLRERVAEMTRVVDANTRSYAGMVDRIGERSEEARRAIELMQTANERLSAALEGTAALSGVADRASKDVGGAIERLLDWTAEVEVQVRALSSAVSAIAPSLTEARATLQTTARQVELMTASTVSALDDLNERAANHWVQAGRDLEDHIARLASGTGHAVMPGGSAAGSDATAIVRQIASIIRSEPTPPAHLVAYSALGVVVGGIVLYSLYAFLHSGIVAWVASFLPVG